MLLQVLLDPIEGGLFGLTEPGDDERKSVSQRLSPLTAFLQSTRDVTVMTQQCAKHNLEVAF